KALYEADKISSAAEAEKTIRSIMTSYEAKPKQWPFTGIEKGVPFLILEPKKYLKQKEIDEFMKKVGKYKEEVKKYKTLWYKYKYVFDAVERLYEERKLTYGNKKTFEKYATKIDAEIAMKKVKELEKAKSTKDGYLLPEDVEEFLAAVKKSIEVINKTESTEDTKKLAKLLEGYKQLAEGGVVTREDVKNLKDNIKKIEEKVTAPKEKPAPPEQPLEIPGLEERRVRVPGMKLEEEKKEEKRETITVTVFTNSAEKESDEKNIRMAEAVVPSSKWGDEGPGRDITINIRVTKNELADENRGKTIDELTKKAVEALRNPPFSLKKSYTLKINRELYTFYLESEVRKAIVHNLPIK
ncbi:MAG: hypothetical protein QW590_01600, partial [Candidatus Bilamarchaeaceae archaeon]